MLVHTTLWISEMGLIEYVFEKPASTGWVVRVQNNVDEFVILSESNQGVYCLITSLRNPLRIINQGSLSSLMRTSRGALIERLRVTDPGGGA